MELNIEHLYVTLSWLDTGYLTSSLILSNTVQGQICGEGARNTHPPPPLSRWSGGFLNFTTGTPPPKKILIVNPLLRKILDPFLLLVLGKIYYSL